MAKEYYILSLKHTHHVDNLIWWKPNNSDYTVDLNRAGRYSHEDVIKNASYYNNNVSTRAIPCEEVDKWTSRVVSIDLINNLFPGTIYIQTEEGLQDKDCESYKQYCNRRRREADELERLEANQEDGW